MNPRLDLLQPYPFERLRALLAGAPPPEALSHVPLSIGEPRHAPPAFIAEALTKALNTLGSYPLALGLMVLALANPSLTREDRDPIPSVAAVIIDKSPSQNFGDRTQQTEAARTSIV